MSDTGDWLRQNAGGSGYPAMKFRNVGDYVAGRIASTPSIVSGKNFDGEDEDSLVIDIEVTQANGVCGPADAERDAASAEFITVWIKAGAQAKAVRDAISQAGTTGLQEGGTFAITHHELGEQKKAGWNRPKLYRAEYKAPVPTVPVGASLI